MNIPFPITIDIFSNYDKTQLKHDPYLRSHFNPPPPPEFKMTKYLANHCFLHT